jgi:hypothetical protein
LRAFQEKATDGVVRLFIILRPFHDTPFQLLPRADRVEEVAFLGFDPLAD